MKRLILGEKIQTHVPFDTVLDMKPYLAPGQASPQTRELIGIISHQGTKEQGHYVTITKRGNDWISHIDAKVTQATLTQLHQTQTYIMIYRKMDHNGVTGTNELQDSIMVGQQFTAKKFKISHKTEHSPEESPLHSDKMTKFPAMNIPRQQGSNGWIIPQPNPIYEEGPPKKNLEILETPPAHRLTPQAPEIRGEVGKARSVELDGSPSYDKADHRQTPLDEKRVGHSENKHTKLPQTISTFLHLSQGRIEELTSLLSELSGTPLTTEMTCLWLGLDSNSSEFPHDSQTKKLIDGLSEDPEDHLAGFIPIIERHNARLKRACLLHEATRFTIEQKWSEGVTLEDIGKFLHSWAPEPYRNKPMPRGMIQALLLIAPNSQAWTPRDLSNCIIRNTEATDSIDAMVRALGKLGTSEEPFLQDSITTLLDGSDLTRTFPRMRTLHDIRKDWLSDEEL